MKGQKEGKGLSQIKGVQKTKQIIKAFLGHNSVNPTVLRHASRAIPTDNCKSQYAKQPERP